MNPDMTYAKARQNADALKALGQTKVHLYGRDQQFPWHLASACEPGSSFRLDIATSVRFIGSEEGLEFSWFWNLEDRDANGTSSTRIDITGCKQVLQMLKGDVRVKFREYLADCATKVKAQGDEYQKIADRQYRDAAVLRDLVNA